LDLRLALKERSKCPFFPRRRTQSIWIAEFVVHQVCTGGQDEPQAKAIGHRINCLIAENAHSFFSFQSFGSEYSPSKRPDLLEILVETLLTTNDPPLPFLFATATTGGLLSPELHERVKKSGVGMFVMFAPQQLVLQHPVTGWFLVSLSRPMQRCVNDKYLTYLPNLQISIGICCLDPRWE